MENTRDSSLWRSLAVAFGDGLAFGVGMKITQNVARQSGKPLSGATASADRFERLEQRLERLERIPIAAPEAAPAPEPVGFARKVIETVVQAVDERLGEYAKQMEHRLAEFEARLAEARGRFDAGIVAAHNRVEGGMRGLAESEERLREEIRSVAGSSSGFDASAAEAAIEMKLAPLCAEVAEMRQRMAAVHDRVEGGMQGLTESEEQLRDEIRRVADSSSGFDASAAEAAIEMKLTPLRGEVAEVRQRMAEGDRTVAEMAAVQHRVEWDVQGFAESQEKLRDEIRRVAESSSSFDASAADAAIELKLAPLRAEIAEMRQRLAESDRTSLDLILAIGQMCRQAAGRIADSAPLPPESAPPLSNAEPPLNGTGDSLHAVPEEPVDPPLESAAPAFTQLKKATALWRFPAVSSFLLAAGGLLLLHYL